MNLEQEVLTALEVIKTKVNSEKPVNKDDLELLLLASVLEEVNHAGN